MSNLGGKREGAGRPLGARNKATAELRDLVQVHTPQAIATLAQVMMTSESDAARVAAANSLLDRRYGKPAQAVNLTGNITVNTAQTIEEMRERVRSLRYPQLATDNGKAVDAA